MCCKLGITIESEYVIEKYTKVLDIMEIEEIELAVDGLRSYVEVKSTKGVLEWYLKNFKRIK